MPRTRSALAHQKVLDATLELISESGVEGASMDAIAGRSGVSKATIYKHWPDKEALLLEAMAELHGLHARPKFDSGDIRADMVAVLAYQPPENSERRKEIAPHFMAYAARNTSFGTAWRDMVMEPPRRELRHLMTLGMKKKELTEDLNLDLSLALLLGPILYWYVFLKRTLHEPRALAEGVVDAFWKAFSVKKRA
jgi:AcrR family transcriptional regulator